MIDKTPAKKRDGTSKSPEAPIKTVRSTKNVAMKSLKVIILLILLGVIGVSVFLWYIFYGPRWGTMHYGVCKVFAERWVDYPTTMKVRDVEYYGLNARVFVSHIDAAGQFNYNVVECEYGKQSLEITRIRLDRKVLSDISDPNPQNHISPQILNQFNKGLGAILMNPPNLTLPRSTKNRPLNELWRGGG